MTLSMILMLVQIIAGLTGSVSGLISVIDTIEKDGGLEVVGARLLAAAKGLATPGALSALKAASPELHGHAVVILSAEAPQAIGAPAPTEPAI